MTSNPKRPRGTGEWDASTSAPGFGSGQGTPGVGSAPSTGASFEEVRRATAGSVLDAPGRLQVEGYDPPKPVAAPPRLELAPSSALELRRRRRTSETLAPIQPAWNYGRWVRRVVFTLIALAVAGVVLNRVRRWLRAEDLLPGVAPVSQERDGRPHER